MQDDNNEYKVKIGTWKKIIEIVFKSKGRLIVLISLSTLIAGLDVLNPYLNKYAIDTFFTKGDYSTLPQYIAVMACVGLLFGVGVWGFIHQGGIIEAKTSYELRKQAFKNLQTLSFSYFDKTPQGWVMARMTSDASRLSNIISWGIVDIVWGFFMMLFILIVMFIENWQLAIIISLSVPVMFLIAYYFRKKILKSHRVSRKYNSQLTAQYSESFLGARTTKSLVIEDSNLVEFKTTAHTLRKSSIKAVIFSAMFSSILLVISYIVVAITMYRGTVLVVGNAITVGTLYLFITYTTNFFDPIMQVSRVIANLQQAQASAERIVGLIETKPDITDTEEVIEKYGTLFNDKLENWEDLKGSIEFKNVSFYYNKDEIILDKFNLKIKAGESVALVGHTGSGKTTIINLISRFYEPCEGEILIDGVDYRKRSLHWVHKRLGYVLQSPHLFSTTIMENIRYGRLEATNEEVIEAAKAIGADGFISKLEKGYDTYVGEGGNLLSIGQKQLISFARAILADPKILILDEATSSIDSESELIIQKATDRLLKDRTSLMVAHRLSTIVNADLIVMLEMGKILEMGTHKELLKKRGAYFELYRNQFIKEKENEFINVI